MKRIVVIGAGQTGAVAVRTLRRRGFDGQIALIGAERHLPYQRPPLTKEYLASGDADGLTLLQRDWCEANNVTLHLGVRAERIRANDGAVELADGSTIAADSVLIASGGSARRLPGVHGERVHYLRTIDDSDRLRAALKPGSNLIVIGAGFIGSEVAATATAMGASVTIVDTLDVPMQRMLGRDIGTVCAEVHRNNGVTVRLGEPVESVTEHSDGVVVTTAAARLEGDAVVVGVGITPNVEVAQRSGVTIDNGVLVDEYCRTNLPNVFAAGDIANHYHPLFDELMRVEHFDNANRQAAAAANNMLGRATVFADPHWFWSDQYDVNIQYTGHAHEWDEVVIRGSIEDLDFSAFYLRDGVLRAAFAVDRGHEVAAARELISARAWLNPQQIKDEDVDLTHLAEQAQGA